MTHPVVKNFTHPQLRLTELHTAVAGKMTGRLTLVIGILFKVFPKVMGEKGASFRCPRFGGTRSLSPE